MTLSTGSPQVGDNDGRWWEDAACRGMDPGLFFPERGDMAAVNRARRICAECPVRKECLADALAFADRWGVRGGLSERQRKRLRSMRRERRVRCVECQTVFIATHSSTKVCSDECRKRRHHESQRRHKAKVDL